MEWQTSFRDWVRLSINDLIAEVDDKHCGDDHCKSCDTGNWVPGRIEVLRGRVQAPLFFGAVAVSELDVMKSI